MDPKVGGLPCARPASLPVAVQNEIILYNLSLKCQCPPLIYENLDYGLDFAAPYRASPAFTPPPHLKKLCYDPQLPSPP